MIEIFGDLLKSGLPALGQGVNCRAVMGAGIAKQFKHRYPGIMKDYVAHCTELGPDALGSIQVYNPPGMFDPVVINMFTQVNPGPNADLDAVVDSTRLALEYLDEVGIDRLGLPLIGCGIGGLDWNDVKEALLSVEEEMSHKVEITIVKYRGR